MIEPELPLTLKNAYRFAGHWYRKGGNIRVCVGVKAFNEK